jgi:hypothetical protein
MTIQAPPSTSTAPSPKTVTFAGALISDVVMPFRSIRVGTGGSVQYVCALDGSTDTINALSGERLPIVGSAILAAGTSAQDLTVEL